MVVSEFIEALESNSIDNYERDRVISNNPWLFGRVGLSMLHSFKKSIPTHTDEEINKVIAAAIKMEISPFASGIRDKESKIHFGMNSVLI